MTLLSHPAVDRYAVIGHPILHSKSPFIHQQFAQQTGEKLQYEAILAPLDQFTETVRQFQHAGGKGINVTLPFKSQAFYLAQEYSQAAQYALTANTLVFQKNGTIFADNTDGIGLVTDLTQYLNLNLTDKKILILGSGGAAHGIIAPLLAEQPTSLFIANRTVDKAYKLAQQFQSLGKLKAYGLDQIPAGPYDLIINATSISLTAQQFLLPHTHDLIAEHTTCYDLAYGSKPTHFLVWAKNQGCLYNYDGLGMLIEQAAAAFYLWRGIYPDTIPVRQMLLSQ